MIEDIHILLPSDDYINFEFQLIFNLIIPQCTNS